MPDDIEMLGAMIRANVRAQRMQESFDRHRLAFELRCIADAIEAGVLVHSSGGMTVEDYVGQRPDVHMLAVRSTLYFEQRKQVP